MDVAVDAAGAAVGAAAGAVPPPTASCRSRRALFELIMTAHLHQTTSGLSDSYIPHKVFIHAFLLTMKLKKEGTHLLQHRPSNDL